MGEGQGAYLSLLLRLAETVTKDRLASRPLELYGAIVNERFSDVAFIEPRDNASETGAALFSLAIPAISKLSLSLALAEHPLHIENGFEARIVGLVSSPDRGGGRGETLLRETVALFSPEDARQEILSCFRPDQAWSVLRRLAARSAHGVRSTE